MIPQDEHEQMLRQMIHRTAAETDALGRLRSSLTTLAALCLATDGDATRSVYADVLNTLHSTLGAYLGLRPTPPDDTAAAALSGLVRECKGVLVVSRKHAPDRIALCLQAVDYIRTGILGGVL